MKYSSYTRAVVLMARCMVDTYSLCQTQQMYGLKGKLYSAYYYVCSLSPSQLNPIIKQSKIIRLMPGSDGKETQ